MSTSTDIAAGYLLNLEWYEIKISMPKNDDYVNGWNGHFVCKCKYVAHTQTWYDWGGDPIIITRWKIWK